MFTNRLSCNEQDGGYPQYDGCNRILVRRPEVICERDGRGQQQQAGTSIVT